MANINSATWSKHEKNLLYAYNDLIFFGKLFLPGDFKKSKTPSFHYEIGEELISDSNKPCAIIVARGHAKTTLVKAKIIRDLCFAKKAKEWGFTDVEQDLFFGWVSSNQKKSKNNVAYVKLHLSMNDRINFYFGNGALEGLRGETWNQEDLVTIYGDRLVSSSNLTSMRGDTLATLKSGAIRYSCVFIDDAENEDNTRTQSSRDKISDNIMNGILPAIEKTKPACRLFLIETPVHWDSFAQNIIDKYEKVQKDGPQAVEEFPWKVIIYSATQPDMPGGVLWPGYLPKKKLDEIKNLYANSPRGVEGYYQEYELQVQSAENALWTRKHLKFWDGYFTHRNGQNYIYKDNVLIPVNTFLGCDPATDIDTKQADYSVIMVIGVDRDANIYVIHYERHRSIPTIALRDAGGDIDGKKGVVDYIIDLYQQYHCRSGVVEDVAMNRSVFQALNSEKRRKGLMNVGIVPEAPGGRNKINRIYTGLSDKFSSGKIHLKETHHELINEILKFGPKMSHDDTIETLYYATRYAYPPNSGISDMLPHGKTKKKHAKRRRRRSWVVL